MSETTTTARSAITWFEIPTADFGRACRFYETILETSLRTEQFGPQRIAVFPYQQPGMGGGLTEKSDWQPGAGGTVVYLDVDGRLDRTLERVEGAGGRLAVPKVELPHGIGWVAHIIDSEGNRIGLHAHS